MLRRLIIKCVCYFREFISFKTFRETSFERIWANLYCFLNTFWHPFREKLGPFWGVKSLQKKTLQPDPPKSLIFNLRAPLDGNMSRKGFQKGSFGGGRERPKNIIFAVRSCLGARMAPRSPQASILEALLIDFCSFLHVFETFFIDLFHSCLHLPWVEGATKNN